MQTHTTDNPYVVSLGAFDHKEEGSIESKLSDVILHIMDRQMDEIDPLSKHYEEDICKKYPNIRTYVDEFKENLRRESDAGGTERAIQYFTQILHGIDRQKAIGILIQMHPDSSIQDRERVGKGEREFGEM